jgi:hypothetical protein
MATVSSPLSTNASAFTSSTSPSIGKINRYDATAGAISATLPGLSALNIGARLALRKIDSTTNTITFSCAGTDTTTEGGTTITLLMPFDHVELEVVAVGSSKAWVFVDTSHAIGSMDVRYLRNPDALIASCQNIPRWATVSQVQVNAGVLSLQYFTCDQSFTPTTLFAETSGSGVTSPTLCRMGIYSTDGSGNLTLIGSTPSDTTLFVGGFYGYAKAMSSSVSLTLGTRYAMATLYTGGSTSAKFWGVTIGIGDQTGPNGTGAGGVSAGYIATGNGVAVPEAKPYLASQLTGQTNLPSTISYSSLTYSAPVIYMRCY